MKKYLLSVFTRLPDEISSLNGIRSLAYFMVIYAHIHRLYLNFGVSSDSELLTNLAINGSMAMDAFFVLSGFLIGGQLIFELNKTGTIHFSNFYIKRFFRIFPPYYIYLIIQFFVLRAMIKADPTDLFQQDVLNKLGNIKWDFLYMTDYIQGTMIHGWSLSVEEKFYLILPTLLYFYFKFWNGRQVDKLFLALFFLPLVFRLFLFHEKDPSDFSYHTFATRFYYPFHMRFDSLFLGVYIGYLYQNNKEAFLKFTDSLVSRMLSWVSLLVLGIILLFTNETDSGMFSYTFKFTVVSLAWALVMVRTFSKQSILGKVFSFQGFVPIAKLSYCAYIIHWSLLPGLGRKFLGANPIQIHQVFTTAIPIGLIVMVYGYFYYLLTEKPFMVLRNLVLTKLKESRR